MRNEKRKWKWYARRTTLLATWSFAVTAVIGDATAQTVLYSENFNNDGNGSRYRLTNNYYETDQQLWTTVPNNLPGDNVITYLEPGDKYFDGSTVPARRATFFADNDLGDNTPGIDLTDDGFALFDAAIQWATDTDGTTPLSINFVIDDDNFEETNNLDITLVERLRDQGHSVEVTNPDLGPVDSDDLIFMASHDNGSAVGATHPDFATTSVPLITGYFHAAHVLGFGSERGENTNGTYELQIVDSAHPLAAGFTNGIVQVVDDAAARQRLTRVTNGTIAPDAKIVATLPGKAIDVPDDFTNFEGEGYLRGGHSTWVASPGTGQPREWQTLTSLNTSAVNSPQLTIDVAAMGMLDGLTAGTYESEFDDPENFDFIKILADDNGDGEFDVLTEFLAVDDFDSEFFGFLAAEDGTILHQEFQSFAIDLPAATSLDLRIDVFTNANDERIGIDNIQVIAGTTSLQAGDSDQDLDFDQLDIVKVQIAAKYLTGQAATWGDGDWDGAPGGEPGNPPQGNGFFDQLDIVSALANGLYLAGPYAAIQSGGTQGDGQTSVIYNANTGEVAVDAPDGKELTSINITSAAGVFLGDKPAALDGAFDNFAADNVFKATFGGSFGSISFGAITDPGLSEEFVAGDLTVVGSLAGGGDLGDVDLVYIPEPSALLLIVIGSFGVLRWRSRKTVR